MRIERWFELAGWTDGRAKGEARDRDLVQGMAASPRRVLQMHPRRTVHRPALGIGYISASVAFNVPTRHDEPPV